MAAQGIQLYTNLQTQCPDEPDMSICKYELSVPHLPCLVGYKQVTRLKRQENLPLFGVGVLKKQELEVGDFVLFEEHHLPQPRKDFEK